MFSKQPVSPGSYLWNCFRHLDLTYPLRSVAYRVSNYLLGPTLRDVLFMPHNNGRLFSESTKQRCLDILNPDISDPIRPNKQQVLKEFTVHDVDAPSFSIDGMEYKIHLRIFESNNPGSKAVHNCIRIGGSAETLDASNATVYPLLKSFERTQRENPSCPGLSITQFSLYGHSVKEQGSSEWKSWKPSGTKEIGAVFFHFLKTMNIPDSMICHSLGSVIFEALGEVDPERLPKTIVLDRAMPSVWKVGEKLYGTIAAYMLFGAAYTAGWSADPEKQLVNLFKRMSSRASHDLKERKIAVIEVSDDYYFSGPGAFSSNFTQQLERGGMQTFRHCFEPNQVTFHSRSHHALPLGMVTNGPKAIDNPVLPMDPYQSVSDAIIRHLFRTTYRLE